MKKEQDKKYSWKVLREVVGTDNDLGPVFKHEKWLEYRNKWEKNPEKNILEALPLQLDVWAVDVCNLKCPMCPRILESREKGIMEQALIEKIFDEVKELGVNAFNFGGLGEPTLLTNLPYYLKKAKDIGVVDVNIHTNGTKLTPEFNRKLIDSGLDRIVISLDGITKERFEKIRIGASYEKVYAGVEDLIEQKSKLNSPTPHIKLNIIDMSIGDDVEKEIEMFIEYWKDRVNRIAVLPQFEFDQIGREVSMDRFNQKYHENFVCSWLWQRLSVTREGNIIACHRAIASNSQIIGNINKQSINEIWHGEKMNELRQLHLSGDYRKNSLCKYCPNGLIDNQRNA